MIRKGKIGTRVQIVDARCLSCAVFDKGKKTGEFDSQKGNTGTIVGYMYPGHYKIKLDSPNFGVIWFKAKELQRL